MIFSSESGNVVIETVIGILIFAGAIYPTATALSVLSTKQSELTDAVMVIGRSWGAVDNSSRIQNIYQLTSWLEKDRGVDIDLICPSGCEETSVELKVEGRIETGLWFVETLGESHTFVRDVYAD